MCFSVRPAQRESPPVRIFPYPFFAAVKAKKLLWMLNLWVIFSCSLMDLSADCQRKWIVSLLSVPAFTPSPCLCLSPPSLTHHFSPQPFLHSYLPIHCLCLSLSFSLSLSLSFSLSLLPLSWLFVSTSVSHPTLPQSSSSGLFPLYLIFSLLPASVLTAPHPFLLAALFQPWWNHLFCPLL